MKNVIYLVFLSLLLASCVSKQFFAIPTQSMAIANGKARIYVIRPSKDYKLYKAKVSQNGVLVGELGAESYLCWEVDVAENPSIIIMSKTENRVKLTVNLVAGETYYFRQDLNRGFITARSQLSEMGESEAEGLIGSLKFPQM